MSDLRPLLDAEAARVSARPEALADTLRRAGRKRLRRQVATIALALALAVVAVGSAFGAFRAAGPPRPAHDVIGPDDVASLRAVWHASLPGHVSAPLVAAGRVFAWSSRTGTLQAFAADCAQGRVSCVPAATTHAGRFYGTTGLATANGVVYAATTDGRLSAFPSCRPGCGGLLWHADVGAPLRSPVVVDGVVYATSTRPSRIYAFDAACADDGRRCSPLWTGPGPDGGAFPTVVGDGFVFTGSGPGPLIAYRVGCATDGSTCRPSWVGIPGLRTSFTTWPVFVDGVAVVLTDRGLVALDPVCFARGPCRPLWRSAPVSGIALAVDGRRVYVASLGEAGDGDRVGVLGFDARCATDGSICEPSWSAGLPNDEAPNFGALLVRDGVVFVGTQAGTVYAFVAACGPSCRPAWSASIGRGHVGLSVADGVLYASSRGRLTAFAPRRP